MWAVTALVLIGVVDAALDRLVVLHRHGARMPLALINDSADCPENGCALTAQGVSQCYALGAYLRRTYSEALGLNDTYNSSLVMSQSTSVARVVQSATAVLSEWFDSASPPLPFVDFVATTDDTRMLWWSSWPSWRLLHRFAETLRGLRKYTRELLGTRAIGDLSAWLGGNCTATPAACAYVALDNILCNTSNNDTVMPAVADMSHELTSFGLKLFDVLLGYDGSDEYERESGSFGYQWVVAALSQLLRGDTALPRARTFHYAAHDWTLYSVYAVLGVAEINPIPPFVDTLLMEAYVDGNVTYLRVLRGWPTQHAGDVDFEASPLVVECRNADGSDYNSSVADCPVGDVLRSVETRGPASALGWCWLPTGAMNASDCATDGAPPSQACLFYRQRCPQVPCGSREDALADPANGYACTLRQGPAAANFEILVSIGLGMIVAGIGLGCGCGHASKYLKTLVRGTH